MARRPTAQTTPVPHDPLRAASRRREIGHKRLKTVTIICVAGAAVLAAITSALASSVPVRHSGSGSVQSSPAAIAAAQQAALSPSGGIASQNDQSQNTQAPTYSYNSPSAASGAS
jgi:hypothetical protein